MKRIAFYGGSFDPVHRGHLEISDALIDQFSLDEFVYLPAFHAPHKMRQRPTSAHDRFAMLCLATNDRANVVVSKMEIDAPDRPYTVETLATLNSRLTNTRIFFVMGADSWTDIATWREWEKVLTASDHIVVTRPGSVIGFDHVTDAIRERVVDLRGGILPHISDDADERHIYISDAVNINISATDIRSRIRTKDASWKDDVTIEVAKHIEKYQIYS
jgi:nicotinate-nucleotide adenylyltransferase